MHRPLKIGSTSSAKLIGSAAQTSFDDAAIPRASTALATVAVVTVASRGFVFMTCPFAGDHAYFVHLNGNVGRALIEIKQRRRRTMNPCEEFEMGHRSQACSAWVQFSLDGACDAISS